MIETEIGQRAEPASLGTFSVRHVLCALDAAGVHDVSRVEFQQAQD
jgi:hypothetical protein